jgi:hypothetical protein
LTQGGVVLLGGGSPGRKYPPNVCSTFEIARTVRIVGLPFASVTIRLR